MKGELRNFGVVAAAQNHPVSRLVTLVWQHQHGTPFQHHQHTNALCQPSLPLAAVTLNALHNCHLELL